MSTAATPTPAPKTYNGWTNYETWCIHLWITNEQDSDSFWRANARTFWNRAQNTRGKHFSVSEQARFDLADSLRAQITDGMPTEVCGMYTDLLGAALSEVNWSEVANAFFEDIEGYEEGQ